MFAIVISVFFASASTKNTYDVVYVIPIQPWAESLRRQNNERPELNISYPQSHQFMLIESWLNLQGIERDLRLLAIVIYLMRYSFKG